MAEFLVGLLLMRGPVRAPLTKYFSTCEGASAQATHDSLVFPMHCYTWTYIRGLTSRS